VAHKDPEKRKKYQEEYRKKNPSKYYYSGRSQARKLADPIQWMFWRSKASAKKRGLEFNIDKEDILVPEFCPILGIRLEFGSKDGLSNSPSLDRIDNSKGYVKGNVAVISNQANSMKRDLTKKVLEKLLIYVSQAEK